MRLKTALGKRLFRDEPAPLNGVITSAGVLQREQFVWLADAAQCLPAFDVLLNVLAQISQTVARVERVSIS